MEQLPRQRMAQLKKPRGVAESGVAEHGALDAERSDLEATRRRLERLVARGGGSADDPLEDWLRCARPAPLGALDVPLTPARRYIKWTEAAYPSGASQLREILERCTREAGLLEQYRQDKRYLTVWIRYAEACKDAQTVYEHMATKQIGSQHDLFYVTRAAMYEASENFGAAERTLEEGLRKGAEPVERLQKRLKEFQHRMVRRSQSRARSKSGRSRERSNLKKASQQSQREPLQPGKPPHVVLCLLFCLNEMQRSQ